MTKLVALPYKTEKALIEGCRKKNRHAQQELFVQYHKKMMAICVRYLNNEEGAFEVLNDAFFKIFDKIKQFKPETKLEAWIRRIVINTTIDHIRKNKSYRKNFISTDEFDEYGKPQTDNDDISEFWDKATSISSRKLLQLINELPPATRIVFNMYAIDGFNHRQIAGKLKISEGTSKWHLSNARQQLKKEVIKIVNEGAYQNESRRASK